MSFICSNPDCSAPDNKKNKSYPSAMECPFCDVPLIEVVAFSEEETSLINNLPYVIAYPLQKKLKEKHAWTKINLLKDTFLNYLKYLGLITASEFFNSSLKDKKMVALFQQALAEPSFGSWNQYIRETLNYLIENNHIFICKDLVVYYSLVETGKKRKLYKGEIEYIDSNGDTQLKKQEATAIGMLINFRNRFLGHGLTLDESSSNKLWDEYYPILKDLLHNLTFPANYPMFKHEHGETFKLQGAELIPTEKGTQPPARVWIENSNGSSLDILPFFVVPGEVSINKEDKEQILTYESYTGKTIKFFSPEGTEKQTSGKILEKLNLLLRDKLREEAFSPDQFNKEIFIARTINENKLLLDTLITEKKVIPGVYVHREEMEIKLREWIGARANVFFIAAEAGSGKTNLLIEIQKQYHEREYQSIFIRAGRMDKPTLKQQIAYTLNINEDISLSEYKAIAGTQDAPVFILIDGINEASNTEDLWQEVISISKLFEPGSLKFIVSSRANTKSDLDRFTITDEDESILYGENKDNQKGVGAYCHWLTAMNMAEMKNAWDNYAVKDKSRFKPNFSYDDIALFDRAIYNQINNPLVLRIFLEIYHSKPLPKKGNKHLNIWGDWLNTFSEAEQTFFKLLTNEIWDKGENELLLDDLINNEKLKPYFTTDVINAPYPRLRNNGWISRYVKDLNSYVAFTVEGALMYLLGVKLQLHTPSFDLVAVQEILEENNKLKRSAIESFLCRKALEGDLKLVCELIDAGDKHLDICVTPLLLFLKAFEPKAMLDIVLENPTDNDWKVLVSLMKYLYELQLFEFTKELAIHAMPLNMFQNKEEITFSFLALSNLSNVEANKYIPLINDDLDYFINDTILILDLANIYTHINNYDKASFWYNKGLSIELNKKEIDTNLIGLYYSRIGSLYNIRGNSKDAIEYEIKCLEIYSKSLNKLHPKVISSLMSLAYYNYSNYFYFDAISTFLECEPLLKKVNGEYHIWLAILYTNIGQCYNGINQPNLAINNFVKSIEILSKLKIGNSKYFANNYLGLTKSYLAIGNYQEALSNIEIARSIYQSLFGDKNPNMIVVYNYFGLIYLKINNYDSSLLYYTSALELCIEIFGEFHKWLGTIYFEMGNVYSNYNYDKALEYYQKCLNIQLITIGKQHLDVSTTYFKIGNCQKGLQLYYEAIKSFAKGFEINKKGGYPFQIAQCYEELSEKQTALGYYLQSAEIRKDDPEAGPEHKSTIDSVKNAIRVAKELGKEDELPDWMK